MDSIKCIILEKEFRGVIQQSLMQHSHALSQLFEIITNNFYLN